MKGSLLLMAAALLLSGCGTSKEQILPPGDSTMRTVWQQKTGKTPDHSTRQHLQRRGITGINASERTMAGRYSWAVEAVEFHTRNGMSKKEVSAMVSMDLGHGDGRGRYVMRVYTKSSES